MPANLEGMRPPQFKPSLPAKNLLRKAWFGKVVASRRIHCQFANTPGRNTTPQKTGNKGTGETSVWHRRTGDGISSTLIGPPPQGTNIPSKLEPLFHTLKGQGGGY